jgi:hypothetical protein
MVASICCCFLSFLSIACLLSHRPNLTCCVTPCFFLNVLSHFPHTQEPFSCNSVDEFSMCGSNSSYTRTRATRTKRGYTHKKGLHTQKGATHTKRGYTHKKTGYTHKFGLHTQKRATHANTWLSKTASYLTTGFPGDSTFSRLTRLTNMPLTSVSAFLSFLLFHREIGTGRLGDSSGIVQSYQKSQARK